jgi:hypothetical protein
MGSPETEECYRSGTVMSEIKSNLSASEGSDSVVKSELIKRC